MKVLFVSPYPPAPDGIGTYTEKLLTAMRSAGHETRVAVPRTADPRALDPRSPDVIGALGPGRAASRALRDSVVAWEPDLIHVQFAVAAFGTQTPALLAWLRGMRLAASVPVVATFHEVTRETAILRAPGRAWYRHLAAQCDAVIVHTRGAQAVLTGPLGVDPAKTSVIPHPEAQPPPAVSTSDDLRAHFGLGDARLLLAFGFVHVDKGLDDLVAALGIGQRPGTPPLGDVRLVIAGTVRRRHGIFRLFEFRDQVHLARVLRAARRELPAGTVVRTGYVPDADVAGWFQAAEAVVLPYRRTEQSGVASIANALGVPVLASTAGGLGEQYARSQWTFPPRDRRKLAEVLGRFLTAPAAEREAPVPADRGAARLDRVVSSTLACYRAVTREAAGTGAGAGTDVGVRTGV